MTTEQPVFVSLKKQLLNLVYILQAIAGVLMPSVTQTLPESLALVIGTFSQRLEEWLQTAMEHLPELLCNVKFRSIK